MAYDYNVVVIGGGAAGLVSAYIAATVKAKVVLIERHKMGGDCLYTGCVPSKALIRTARFIADMKRSKEFGVREVKFEFSFADVMDRVQRVIKDIEPHDSVERYTGLGVECVTGEAKVIDPHHVTVNGKTLSTKNIILAVGASPFVPPIKGIETVKYRTSENLWQMRDLPKRLIVLGGGPIGCEMAQAFARLGSKVTQVEQLQRILPREDEDVAEEVHRKFLAEGIDIKLGTKAEEVLKTSSGFELKCSLKDGSSIQVPFDEILVAVGRKANTSGQGFENLGLELNQNGTLKVDAYMRTTKHSNIYACGDASGPYQFTHTASHQAWYCAVNALFSPLRTFKADYRVIPWCTFTDPEVAHVGLNEQMCKQQNIAYEVTKYGIDDLDRAIAEAEAHGFVKVLTAPKSDRVIGCTIVGHAAGELIGEFVAAMKHGFGLNKILGTIHSYPTMIEANKYAAGVWKKKHKPEAILQWVEKYHAFRRS